MRLAGAGSDRTKPDDNDRTMDRRKTIHQGIRRGQTDADRM
jgi:hypothetical protein